VFKLSPGEAGAALNGPRDTAYVILLIDYDYSLDDGLYPDDLALKANPVRTRFVSAVRSGSDTAQAVIRDEMFRQYVSWRQALYDEFDVQGLEKLDGRAE
jgi:hypothetical protein